MNLSQNTPLWFDKLTTSGANPLALSLSKGGHGTLTTISGQIHEIQAQGG
jgi:hypothetical protein